MRLNIYWMGKELLIKSPFRGLMMWLGDTPLAPEKSGNVVAASVLAIQQADGPVQLIVPPDGTRSDSAWPLADGGLSQSRRIQESRSVFTLRLCCLVGLP